jgi:uncharacterized protein YneF (UPF0154 family)
MIWLIIGAFIVGSIAGAVVGFFIGVEVMTESMRRQINAIEERRR